jgi:hypothetical protein
LGKTGIFAHPRPEKRLFVGQNRHFCPSVDEKQAFRWAKQALLPNRVRKKDLPLGKTGVFAQRRRGEHPLPFRGNAWVTGRSTRGRRDRRKDRRREPRGQLRRAKT